MKQSTKDAIENKPNSARAKAAYADMQRREAASNVLGDEHKAKMSANAKKLLVKGNQDTASSLFKSNRQKQKIKEDKAQATINKMKKNSSSSSAKPADKTTKTWKDVKSVAAAKAAGLKNYTGKDGKKKAAIDASEIKKGESMTQAFNRIQGKTASSSAKTTKTPKKVGGIRKFLLGKDGKFGGARGAIDFLPGKSRKKKEDKPVNKMGGGMMKSKMSSKGGKRGGMRNGGLAMTKVNGKSVPAFAADGKGANDLAPTKRKMGGMMKSKGMSKGGAMKSKGMAKGGVMKPKGMSKGGAMKSKGMSKGGAMKKKGYAMGGAVRSKMASKGGKRGGVSSKPRGVGVAKRGYGKAMR